LYFFAVLSFSAFFTSCSTVKNNPVRTPFVYQTSIEIDGKFSTDEKKKLRSQLEQQLHDSINVRRQQKFIFWNVLNSPPVYDSINAGKSIIFMRALLNSLGYYRDTISFQADVDSVGDQYRTNVRFNVFPGKLIRLDSISYSLVDSSAYNIEQANLQELTLKSLSSALIKKGDAFSKPFISSEFDRLSDLYRNNGYLKFTREELIALWDTVGIDLLRPTVDPIEQAQLLAALRRRRENPIADLQVRLKSNVDTSHITRYYVGNVFVYPDFNIDTAIYRPVYETSGGYQFISYQQLFKPKRLTSFIFLKQGELYRQSNYLRTQNKFNSIGAWRLVSIVARPRNNEDTVDFDIRLTPANKYSYSANLEGSYNQGDVIRSSNLLGIGVALGVVNSNFMKSAAQSSFNIRYGIELSSEKLDSIQTRQFNLGYTIQLPRALPRSLFTGFRGDDIKSFLAFNVGFTDRKDYFLVKSITTSWGYELNKKNMLLAIRWPNIEFNQVEKRSLMEKLIAENRSYQYIFNDGLIVSAMANLTIAGGHKNITNLGRFGIEGSGLPGFLYTAFHKRIYRFVKADAEFTQKYKIRRSALAWRAFVGMGYGLPFQLPDLPSGPVKDSSNFYLPFFREYYAGGANSMRAWAVRKLGPGSTIKSFDKDKAPDRFGDMRIELNGEYRFYMAQLYGFVFEGALFTDVGNIWFLRKNPDFPDGEFHFKNLWRDLAIGAGTGLRIDFGFVKLRFDYAYKVKNPSPDTVEEQNKWFYNWQLLNGQFQLGIDYAF
jgi:outer membrane protein insertion porin family